MNTEQLIEIAQRHELLWRMYGERNDFVMWKRAQEAIMNSSFQQVHKDAEPQEVPIKKWSKLKGRPSPLRGRKLSPEHLQKLKIPKTEAQKAALRVPKVNKGQLGKHVRTLEQRARASEKTRGHIKSPETLAKIGAARQGTKHPLYRTLIFGAVHPVHGMFYGDRLQLCKQFPGELDMGELRRLAIGEYASYKGWRLIQKAPHPSTRIKKKDRNKKQNNED